MKHPGDSSIWKSLAVAFGDGLAFGVGMKIAQGAPRNRQSAEPEEAPPPAPATAPAPAAVAPPPAESLDLQMLGKLLASIDAKLARYMGEVEQRLQTSETQMQETLATRLRAYVDAHAATAEQALEERLRREINETGDHTARLLVDTIETRLLGRIAVLENEIRALRASSAGSREKLHTVLEGFSRACQDAMRGLEDESGSPGADCAPSSGDETNAPDADPPASPKIFSYPARPERKMPIPLVSSITVFLFGVAALGSAGWTF